jgi:hypothetical protein
MQAGLGWRGGVKAQKYTSGMQFCCGEIFFRAENFFVDDDSGLSAIGSVH